MTKRITILFLLALIIQACRQERDLSEFSSEGARHAAEQFYSCLIQGEGQAYVDNMREASSMDSCKYKQFLVLMEQFIHDEQQVRGGILSAKATDDKIVDSTAMVYLDVMFGDSTSERIILPVIYSAGRWWIR